jgi:hypothetical protein
LVHLTHTYLNLKEEGLYKQAVELYALSTKLEEKGDVLGATAAYLKALGTFLFFIFYFLFFIIFIFIFIIIFIFIFINRQK